MKVEGVLRVDVDKQILISELIGSLPDDEQAVMKKYLEECTIEEAAMELDISVSTVKRLQSRALEQLRSN